MIEADEFTAEWKRAEREFRRYASRFRSASHSTDDLVQETLLRAWERRHLFKRGTKFIAWLQVVMFNRNSDLVSAIKRRPEWHVASSYSVDWLSSPPQQEDRILTRLVLDAFHRLKPIHRDAIVMNMKGYLHRQTADILKVPVGTVCTRLKTARAALSTQLAA